MKGIGFIAALFCMALAALFSGGMALYENIDFHFNGRSAHMQFPETERKVHVPSGSNDYYRFDVKYVGPDGEVLVRQKQMTGEIARRMADGAKIPVTYLKQKPQTVMYQHDELPNPWGWLIVGTALAATFVYALRLRRRDSQ